MVLWCGWQAICAVYRRRRCSGRDATRIGPRPVNGSARKRGNHNRISPGDDIERGRGSLQLGPGAIAGRRRCYSAGRRAATTLAPVPIAPAPAPVAPAGTSACATNGVRLDSATASRTGRVYHVRGTSCTWNQLTIQSEWSSAAVSQKVRVPRRRFFLPFSTQTDTTTTTWSFTARPTPRTGPPPGYHLYADPHTPYSRRTIICSLLARATHRPYYPPLFATVSPTYSLYSPLATLPRANFHHIWALRINASPPPKNGSTVQRAAINYIPIAYYTVFINVYYILINHIKSCRYDLETQFYRRHINESYRCIMRLSFTS